MFSKREKKLIDYDPKDLSLELLLTLQGGLMAKLLYTNDELIRRFNLLSGAEIPGAEKSAAVLASGAERLAKFNSLLESEIAHGQGRG